MRSAQRQDLFVVFDEFSGIEHVDGAAALLRTELQHHYQDLGIIFAGSQPSTMRTLFSEQSQPFFAQADLVEIDPLAGDAIVAIVDDGFAATDRDAGACPGRIAAFVSGHPQRAMQLADGVWRHTPVGSAASDATWEAALDDVRASVDLGTERMFSLLPSGQQKTLRVIATGGSIYGTAASVLDLAPGTARAASESLLGSGFLLRSDGRLELVDPLLADWIRRRFPLRAAGPGGSSLRGASGADGPGRWW